MGSGYLPVTRAANDMETIRNSGLELSQKMDDILTYAVDAVQTNEMYTPKAFEGGGDARSVVEHCLSDIATADRATVEERMAEGQSAADAEAEFLTEEYFENWYQGLCNDLSQYEG